ncbi:MAG TPA: hypothetical protein PLG90_01440 [Ignavibacteria bacterium]|nr:hypothetical protein [Ignavibacteria bacterium]
MENPVIDILGWIGSLAVLSAYALSHYNKISNKSLMYFLLNAVGSLFLIINTYYYFAYPSTFLNVVWMLIGVHGIYKFSIIKK